MLWLGRKQAEIFSLDNVGYCDSLVTLKVPPQILETCYSILTKRSQLLHIEILPTNEKIIIWNIAKEIAKDRLDNEGLIRLSHCLITLEYFLQ